MCTCFPRLLPYGEVVRRAPFTRHLRRGDLSQNSGSQWERLVVSQVTVAVIVFTYTILKSRKASMDRDCQVG